MRLSRYSNLVCDIAEKRRSINVSKSYKAHWCNHKTNFKNVFLPLYACVYLHICHGDQKRVFDLLELKLKGGCGLPSVNGGEQTPILCSRITSLLHSLFFSRTSSLPSFKPLLHLRIPHSEDDKLFFLDYMVAHTHRHLYMMYVYVYTRSYIYMYCYRCICMYTYYVYMYA